MRINSIDVLRFFAAFAVVGCHKILFDVSVIVPMLRSAIPLFFMVSGYFCYNATPSKQIQKIKRILFITLSAYVFYMISIFGFSVISDKVPSFIEKNFSLNSIIELVCFNEAHSAYHLWYVFAFLYCLVIDYFVSKFKFDTKHKKIMVAIIIALILGDLILGKYSVLIWGGKLPYYITRNFLFAGLPFFYIGKMFRGVDVSKIKLNDTALIIIMVVSAAVSDVVSYLLRFYKVSAPREQFLTTTTLALAAFIFALKHPLSNPSKIPSKIAEYGRKYSLMIYIIHPFFLKLFDVIVEKLGTNVQNIYNVAATIIIFVVSLLFSIVFYKVKGILLCKLKKA